MNPWIDVLGWTLVALGWAFLMIELPRVAAEIKQAAGERRRAKCQDAWYNRDTGRDK